MQGISLEKVSEIRLVICYTVFDKQMDVIGWQNEIYW